jgi:predicted ATP-binding protein involved in virulence
MESFSRIQLEKWRQFSSVDIDLNAQLCVLTGANGCGKTTIMNVLARHFGWNINFVSTPYLSEKKEKKFWSDVFKQRETELSDTSGTVRIGTINYSSGGECKLSVLNETSEAKYSLTYGDQRTVEGIHIPSHRPITNYAAINEVPLNPKSNEQHFLEFQQLLFQTYGEARSANPSTSLKKSLISLAVFGYGNTAVNPDREYRDLFEGFQEILIRLLPKTLGFKRLEIRKPDIVFITDTGDFSLDSMSGGISAIVGMAWQIHMYGANRQNCTVIIDEPENHLHPSMQREFLPSLVKAFPSYRFIISTHSPFVVTSSRDAYVYGLVFNNDRKIVSQRLEAADLSASPNKILREILDVPTTIPIWVEEKIQEILSRQASLEATEENIERLFGELKELGLDSALQDFSKKG